MSENYIVINGKRAELTEEQLKQLGIEVPKANPFERAKCFDEYYCIESDGEIVSETEYKYRADDKLFAVANYCTDKAIMEQRALHETLSRLLWRYSMEHDGDKIDFTNVMQFQYAIKCSQGKFEAVSDSMNIYGTVYFYTKAIAEAAIKEIIEPFMKEYPEFKW